MCPFEVNRVSPNLMVHHHYTPILNYHFLGIPCSDRPIYILRNEKKWSSKTDQSPMLTLSKCPFLSWSSPCCFPKPWRLRLRKVGFYLYRFTNVHGRYVCIFVCIYIYISLSLSLSFSIYLIGYSWYIYIYTYVSIIQLVCRCFFRPISPS